MYLRKIFIDRARYNSENKYCSTCHKKIYWPEKYREKKFYKDYVRQHAQYIASIETRKASINNENI